MTKPMTRIIGRDIFEGKPADEFKVVIHDLGHGQKEASICRSIWWEHVGTMSTAAYAEYLAQVSACAMLDQDAKALANAERSARRAKTKVRRICKNLGVDALLTLTYKANMQDEALCKRHLQDFVRRIRRLIPKFAYVAAFERQKRGAWHVHLAIHALPFHLPWAGVKVRSYSVVRAVWRSVVGDLGGNIDQARKKRHSRKSPAQMASYISKYVLKAFLAGEEHSHRYSSSSHSLPDPVRMRFMHASLADLVGLVYDELSPDSSTVVRPWLSDFKDRFFLISEPAPPHHNGV